MKLLSIFLFMLSFSLLSCMTENCPEGINLLPMYGGAQKCSSQLEADKRFIELCDNGFGNRETACEYHVEKGWEFLNSGDLDTAMKMFNQAWLLDSINNAQVYEGFGCVLVQKMQYKEAIDFFDKSLKIDSIQSRVWRYSGTCNISMLQQSSQQEYLDNAVFRFKKAVEIDSLDSESYRFLTSAYSMYYQQDSAKKYLKITDKLNPNLIDGELRERITSAK